MMVSAIILCATFLGIFTEQFHGIERAKFAMAGAGAIIVAGQYVGFYSPQLALEAIDWNVVFLLAIMMLIVSIMISTGGFDHLAQYLARVSAGSQLKLLILLGDPPNLMIGSVAGISFNTFIVHMGPPVLLAWLSILLGMRFLFKKELTSPIAHSFDQVVEYTNRRLWYKSLFVMLVMVVLFVIHDRIGWEPWLVAAACLTLLVFMSRTIELEAVTMHLETPLLIFFISLFVVIGGVEHSGLLEVIGDQFRDVIAEHPKRAALQLLWVAAIFSALIDNIPFTAAMIPVLSGLQQDGINVSVLWWALAMGVGMGGNGSHIGSTANVYIVTISERLARETGKPELAITPMLWIRKGTPVMLVTLIVCSLFIWFGYDYLFVPNP
jgi:Na+/H+ antiporter NhaD/arsenite permease-like protein